MHLFLPLVFANSLPFSDFIAHFCLFWTLQLHSSFRQPIDSQLATSSNPRGPSNKMRRYDIISGILLILSIFNFSLAAPLLVKEKRQTYVDAVMLNIPKDVITVLGKRGEREELGKLLENYFKYVAKPTQSSETHAASGSAPLGPDHGSTSAVQAPEPNPAPSTANPDPLMGPSASPMQPTGHFDWNYLLNKDIPLPGPAKPSSSEEVEQNLDAQPLAEQPLSAAPMHPGTSADPVLNWKHLTNVDFKPKPEAPKKSGQQAGQDPMLPDNMLPLKPKPTDEFGSKYWSSMSLGDLLPKLEPPKDVGKAHESQLGQQEEPLKNEGKPDESAGAHSSSSSAAAASSDQESTNVAQAPKLNPASSTANTGPLIEPSSPAMELIYPPGSSRYQSGHELPGPSNAGPSNSPPTTTLDSGTGLGVYPSRPLSPPTDLEIAAMGYRPPPPPADPDLWLSPLVTPTEADSFRYPGSAAHPPSPGAGLSTVPEHEVGTPPPPPKSPDGL